MATPLGRGTKTRSRLYRLLQGRPRRVRLDMMPHTDWAGCIRTRKSTTGGAFALKVWIAKQSMVALSSVGAEFAAALRGASEGMARRSTFQHLPSERALRVVRGGRNLPADGLRPSAPPRLAALWIQERRGGLEEVPGAENSVDLMIKLWGRAHVRADDKARMHDPLGQSQVGPQMCIGMSAHPVGASGLGARDRDQGGV